MISPGLKKATWSMLAASTWLGWPLSIRILDPVSHGLPELPKLGLVLHKADKGIGPTGEHLASIIGQALGETLSRDWLSNGRTA
jgi:hypothetical protein